MGIFDVISGKKKEEVKDVMNAPSPEFKPKPFVSNDKPFPEASTPFVDGPKPFPPSGPIPMNAPVRDHQSELVLAKLDLVLQKVSDIEKRLEEIEKIAKEE